MKLLTRLENNHLFLAIGSIVTVALSFPLEVGARHNTSIDSRSLDDDIVEDLPIPILFGVDIDDVAPDFGDPRGGGTRLHEGQDLRAPEGTPIVSPTKAIVTSVGTGESAGRYVYTANPGGVDISLHAS